MVAPTPPRSWFAARKKSRKSFLAVLDRWCGNEFLQQYRRSAAQRQRESELRRSLARRISSRLDNRRVGAAVAKG